jgi:pimeloyl-ACP methyl ester carboxylesterase
MANYGPEDGSWQLWHEGPVLDRENVVLVHGFILPLAMRKRGCSRQFGALDSLLQTEARFNVWQFEYAASPWGTYETTAAYAARLGEALDRIGGITGNGTCSIVAYSMGGVVARQYIASGGKSRVDRLLTLATPHMGTLRFEPFSLKWADRIYPRVAAELRPDSRCLWNLNESTDSSIVPEFAALGGYSWGRTDGLVELGSASLVSCKPDGSMAEDFYFAAVKRSHLNINRIKKRNDEVFELIHAFLLDGVAGISSLRPPERPADYRVPSFLAFCLKESPRWRMVYPYVTVPNTGHRYAGIRVFSQGARTDDGACIFTVQLRPDDDGEARIYYGQGEYASVCIHRGQSTIVSEPIGPADTADSRVASAAAQ